MSINQDDVLQVFQIMDIEMEKLQTMNLCISIDRSGYPKPSDIRALLYSINDDIKDGVINFQEFKSFMGKNVSDGLCKLISKVLDPDRIRIS